MWNQGCRGISSTVVLMTGYRRKENKSEMSFGDCCRNFISEIWQADRISIQRQCCPLQEELLAWAWSPAVQSHWLEVDRSMFKRRKNPKWSFHSLPWDDADNGLVKQPLKWAWRGQLIPASDTIQWRLRCQLPQRMRRVKRTCAFPQPRFFSGTEVLCWRRGSVISGEVENHREEVKKYPGKRVQGRGSRGEEGPGERAQRRGSRREGPRL